MRCGGWPRPSQPHGGRKVSFSRGSYGTHDADPSEPCTVGIPQQRANHHDRLFTVSNGSGRAQGAQRIMSATSDHYDIIIIGSGAGGASALAELSVLGAGGSAPGNISPTPSAIAKAPPATPSDKLTDGSHDTSTGVEMEANAIVCE